MADTEAHYNSQDVAEAVQTVSPRWMCSDVAALLCRVFASGAVERGLVRSPSERRNTRANGSMQPPLREARSTQGVPRAQLRGYRSEPPVPQSHRVLGMRVVERMRAVERTHVPLDTNGTECAIAQRPFMNRRLRDGRDAGPRRAAPPSPWLREAAEHGAAQHGTHRWC